MLWKREKSFPSAVRWAYEKTGRYNVRARRLINGSGILFALNYSATQSHDREHNMLKKKKKGQASNLWSKKCTNSFDLKVFWFRHKIYLKDVNS